MARDTTNANFMLGNCGDAKGHEGKKVGDTRGCQENSGGCQGNRRGCKGNDGNVKAM